MFQDERSVIGGIVHSPEIYIMDRICINCGKRYGNHFGEMCWEEFIKLKRSPTPTVPVPLYSPTQ